MTYATGKPKKQRIPSRPAVERLTPGGRWKEEPKHEGQNSNESVDTDRTAGWFNSLFRIGRDKPGKDRKDA